MIDVKTTVAMGTANFIAINQSGLIPIIMKCSHPPSQIVLYDSVVPVLDV